MSFMDAKEFQQSNARFPVTTAACGHRLATHSMMVNLMMGEMAPFTVEYRQCVQQLRPHFDLSLVVHYSEAGGEVYLMALCILYWLTQQFLYFLTERKFGQNPLLPAFSILLQHLHMKTLDGFLGHLPASWMEQVGPSATTPEWTLAGQASGTSWRSHDGTMVLNTNYHPSLRKRWQASGHSSIAQLLQAYTGEGTLMVPMMGEQPVCLSWHLRGHCFDNCGRISAHKQASQAVLPQIHTLLDTCSMPASN